MDLNDVNYFWRQADDVNYFWRQADEEQTRWEKAEKQVPSQDEIDEVADLIGRRNAAGIIEPLSPALLPPGIAIHTFSYELTLVYWEGDPKVKAVINTPVAELPKFLAHQDRDVRTLATWRLDALVESLE